MPPHTQRLKMAALRSLLSFGHKIGMLPTNVSMGLRQPKIKDTLNPHSALQIEVQRDYIMRKAKKSG
jgi:integrase/recombinase XerD